MSPSSVLPGAPFIPFWRPGYHVSEKLSLWTHTIFMAKGRVRLISMNIVRGVSHVWSWKHWNDLLESRSCLSGQPSCEQGEEDVAKNWASRELLFHPAVSENRHRYCDCPTSSGELIVVACLFRFFPLIYFILFSIFPTYLFCITFPFIRKKGKQ